ncbi:hypothetical protein ASF45_04225 [Pseudorhodoferax sp. Leaf265]|nr:hypothetical protein ASF45_04225 [Pseudorhodoferax sp. Leaf265]
MLEHLKGGLALRTSSVPQLLSMEANLGIGVLLDRWKPKFGVWALAPVVDDRVDHGHRVAEFLLTQGSNSGSRQHVLQLRRPVKQRPTFLLVVELGTTPPSQRSIQRRRWIQPMFGMRSIDEVPPLVPTHELVVIGMNELVGLGAGGCAFGYPVGAVFIPNHLVADVSKHLKRLPPTPAKLCKRTIPRSGFVDAYQA